MSRKRVFRLKDALELVLILSFLFCFSFFLNFFWEAIHAVYLYEKHDFNASSYIPMLVYVSSVDGLLIEGLYAATGLLWRKILWIRKFNRLQAFFFACFGILIAGFVEYRAVYGIHRWAYNPKMPTIAGLGLSPLLQLTITGLLSAWLTKEILYCRGLLVGGNRSDHARENMH